MRGLLPPVPLVEKKDVEKLVYMNKFEIFHQGDASTVGSLGAVP